MRRMPYLCAVSMSLVCAACGPPIHVVKHFPTASDAEKAAVAETYGKVTYLDGRSVGHYSEGYSMRAADLPAGQTENSYDYPPRAEEAGLRFQFTHMWLRSDGRVLARGVGEAVAVEGAVADVVLSPIGEH